MAQAQTKDALPEGFKLLWYEIHSVLGRGGFGITYLAKDKNLACDVAIKEYFPLQFAQRKDEDHSLEPTIGDDDQLFSDGLKKFVVEARTLAKLNHSNIVRVLSVFDFNNTAYIVMDFERGNSLEQILKIKKTLSEGTLKAVTMPLLDGLSFIHTQGFIHRDIKPSNIVIRDENKSPVLIDFGSARDSLKQSATMTNLVTYGYTPVEQYNGKATQQGPWTDIYAMAATLYTAIRGEKPAEAMNRATELMHNGQDPYIPLVSTDAVNSYSRSFIEAIDLALSLKYRDRPKNVEIWRDMLNGKVPATLDESMRPSSQKGKAEVTVLADHRGTKEEADFTEVASYTPTSEHTAGGTSNKKFIASIAATSVIILLATTIALYLLFGLDRNEPVTAVQPTTPQFDQEREKQERENQAALKEADERYSRRLAELEARLESELEEQKLRERERLEAARREAEQKARAAAQLKPKPRQTKITQQAAYEIAQSFTNAYEKGDMLLLKSVAIIAKDNHELTRQLFDAYAYFDLQIESLAVVPSINAANVKISIDEVQTADGGIVKPSASWRYIKLQIKNDRYGTLKAYWN